MKSLKSSLDCIQKGLIENAQNNNTKGNNSNADQSTANNLKSGIVSKEKKFKGWVVTKSNQFIRANAEFSLLEERILNGIISQIQSKPLDSKIENLTFHATDYAKIFSISNRNAYIEMKAAAESLQDKKIKIVDENNNIHSYVLVPYACYQAASGKITLSFNNKLRHHLTGLNTQFTSWSYLNASNLKKRYSLKLYEIIMSWAKIRKGRIAGYLKIDVVDLRFQMSAPEHYTWGNFQQSCLRPAISELADKLNFQINYEGIKEGRKIQAIHLKFQQSAQLAH